MASRYINILCNSVKFPIALNRKFTFLSLKSNYHMLTSPFRYNLRHGQRFYATAAYKEVEHDDTMFLMNSVTENADLDSALSKLDWIVKHNGRISLKSIEAAFHKVSGKDITAVHGLRLLQCCKYMIYEPPSKRIELANQIWNRFQKLGITFDVKHYNAHLDVHINNNLNFNPTDLLNSMAEKNIEPNRITCILLIKKYCKDGNLNEANEILHFMKESGFPANEEVFNHLIEGHLRNNDFAGAKDLLEVMSSSNLKPTEETYTLFASFFAANGNIEEMMSYLNAGEKIPPNIVFSNNNRIKVIEALAISGNYQRFESIFSLMEEIHQNNQECINLAIELIHKGFIDAAYELIINVTNSHFNQGTNIFIKQLIKINRPVSEIVTFCNDILNKGANDLIFVNAARAAIEYGNFNCATSLYKERLAQGYPIRASHFWPIMSTLKQTGSSKEIWKILEKMAELGVPADFRTYLDHIFPALGIQNPNDIIINIKKTGQNVETASDALFVYYCSLGEIDYASLLIYTVPVRIGLKLDFRNFLDRYQDLQIETKSRDFKSQYLKVLKYILENIQIIGKEHESKILKGSYLAELIMFKPQVFEALLKNEILTFGEDVLNACEKHLIKNNPNSIVYLNKIRIKKLGINREEVNMTVKDEDQHLNYLESQNLSCKAFLTERIFYNIKKKNIDRLSELLSLYKYKGFQCTPSMLSDLITLHSAASDVKKAKEYFLKLKQDFPSFKLNIEKLFDYATVLTKYTEFNETLNVLKDCLTESYISVNKNAVVRSIKRFTAVACESHNVEFVKNIKNLLIPVSEFLGIRTISLEPLINVHLNRKDLLSAVNEYQNCIMRYRIPACLDSILRKCINLGDERSLQNVIDLTINYVGKNVAFVELAVACIETGYNSKAFNIIHNFGHEANQDMFEEVALRLSQKNKFAELEQFIAAAKPYDHVLDIKKVYLVLLKVCASYNDYTRATEMFNTITKIGIEPSSEFVDILINLLKRNNQPIPLSVQSKSTPDLDECANIKLMKPIENFTKHLEEGNAEMALNELGALKKGYIRSISSKSLSDLIHLCLEKKCIKTLSSNVNVMSYIIESATDVLKPILEKYSVAGDIEKLVAIANFIPDFSLRHIDFSKYFSEAFILSGKHENLLSELEERCDKKNKLFSTFAFEELLKFPQFEERLLKLAVKYCESNFAVPIAFLWAHYFVKENYDKANEIYHICKLISFPVYKVDAKILKVIRQDKNVNLGKKYITFINQINVTQKVKERSYGALLDVLVLKERYKEAMELVLESEKLQLSLHKHYRSTLMTLKSVLERDNQPVLFSIPSETYLSEKSSYSD